MFLAILVIASSLFFTASVTTNNADPLTTDYIDTADTTTTDLPDSGDAPENDNNSNDKTKASWEQSAIQWLIDSQSPNGGWGAGSHSYQNVRDPNLVQTDPATTAFAAMALLKAGGPLKANPHRDQIMKALDRILKDIDSRPNNGRITSLEGTQPQVKLGQHIDASMALEFLTDMSEQITDSELRSNVDKAAEICIDLIQGSQNVNGGWAGGGWAPVLQSAMANNALENAQGKYDVDTKAIENSRKYQADNVGRDGIKSGDAAGIELYAVVSAQKATSSEATKTAALLPASVRSAYQNGAIDGVEIAKELEAKGIKKDEAERMANSYVVNETSTKALQDEKIWEGFGNNGGEEYLSYMLASESLAQKSKDEWLKWKQTIEPKFKQSQNENGSWTGHHCITSPVFCTAAIVQAWNAGNVR